MSNNEWQRQLDTRALELAAEAKSRVMAHEEVCEVRHAGIRRSLDSISSRMDKWMYALLGTLVLSLGYFLVKFGLPGITH